MKKPVLIALAILVSTLSFSQKKELRAVDKAIKSDNYAEAKAALLQVEPLMSAMDDKQKAQFYLLKSKAFFANGAVGNDDINTSIDNLNKVGNSNASETAQLRKSMENSLLLKANDLYKSESYVDASRKFEQLYKVVPNDTTYLYYAAVSSVSGEEYEAALNHYLQLDELGYSGQETVYFSIDKETGAETISSDETTRDLLVKSGQYIKPGERMTGSKSGEITKNIAVMYLKLDRNDEAIKAIQNARKKDPNNTNLILTEANLQYKLGNLVEYKSLIKTAAELDPNNIDLFYNLGVISAEAGDIDEAKSYYQSVIDKDPTYINAHTNMAALILEDEQALIEEMNGLGTSAADDRRYDELKEQRADLYKSAIPHLETVMEVDPENLQAAKTLMNIYSAIGDTPNYKKMKEKAQELEGN